MTGGFFDLRLKMTTGGLKWDENGSIRGQKLKIKKIPWVEKFSAHPKDDPLKLRVFEAWLSLMAEMEKIGKNGLSINKMKGKIL